MNNKRKILIVGPDLSLTGGVAHHVKTLLSSPLKHNFKLDYFKVGKKQNDNSILILIRFILTPFCFLWKMCSSRPDLVHLNPSFDSKSLFRELIIIVLCKLFCRQIIVQFHGGNISNLIKRKQLPIYIKILIKLTNHFVLLTRLQKQPFLKYCSPDRMSVIPNMIDTRRIRANKKRHNAGYRILYMSKIESKKGVFDVLESVELVINQFPKAKFLFAGDGPDKEKARLLCCENGLEEHVKFLGYLQDQRKVNFLVNGDIFLFPSHYQEGMPYALLEAMAAGLPVIATSTGGIPEIIKHNGNGLLTQPQQSTKLAEAINFLLENQHLREKFGKKNRYKAETEYDINVVCEQFKQLYQKLSSYSGSRNEA